MSAIPAQSFGRGRISAVVSRIQIISVCATRALFTWITRNRTNRTDTSTKKPRSIAFTAASAAVLCLAATAGTAQGHQSPVASRWSSRLALFQATEAGERAPAQTPRSARDLLSNLKTALEQGSLLHSAFYSEENLFQFFGARDVRWITNETTEKHLIIRGLDYIPARNKSKTQVGIRRTSVRSDGETPQSLLWSAVTVTCSCYLRIEDIEAVFGSAGRELTEVRRPSRDHFAVRPPARDPMGNRRATYGIESAEGHSSTFSVAFDPDGNITLVEAIQKEEP